MKLLVSVRSAAEAAAALAGGADIIDAKEPGEGPLGPVPLGVFRAVHDTVSGLAPVSAALGDHDDEKSAAAAARAFAAAGARLVKMAVVHGHLERVRRILTAAVGGAKDGSPSAGVIAVAYANAEGLDLRALTAAAAGAGAVGVLVDTSDKQGPGLAGLLPAARLAAWTREAHEAGLLVAAAGRLTADDLCWVRDAGADIAGVRGAACLDGRNGVVSERLVRELHERFRTERV